MKIFLLVYSPETSQANQIIPVDIGVEEAKRLIDSGGLNAWNASGYAVVPTSIPEEPGFKVALALVALLVVACGVRWKKVSRK